ncbi:hypothetical protein F4780DRAFT_779621 [Xylariomycetidae sp. FL0641]|nr:hypothetical protein F4780DRAFT_779621 [Xylariomycetidae sp. FL0641]
MPSNKDRLYVVLYARGGTPKMPELEDTYHWALMLGPKIEPSAGGQGTRFHAKERLVVTSQTQSPQTKWTFETRRIPLQALAMQLVRVVIAKVNDADRLRAVLEEVPVRPELRGWNCVAWVKEALEEAKRDGKTLGTSARDWESVRDTAMWYVAQKKAAHRFDGKGQFDQRKAATWDMLDQKELHR